MENNDLETTKNNEKLVDDLKQLNVKQLNYFNINENNQNLLIPCRVVSVYDGDTFTGALFCRQKANIFKIRICGFDAPEKRPRKNIPDRENVIKKAKEARKFLISLFKQQNDIVYLHTVKNDKYGRILGNVYLDSNNLVDTCVTKLMIDNNHGYAYNGGKKKN